MGLTETGKGGLISGLIAAGSAAVSGMSDMFSGKRRFKRSSEYNERMWNAANAYNSPQAQMERLKEAGLNPNMIYGSGGNTGMATAPPQAPGYPGVSFKLNPLSDMLAFANVNKVEAQTNTENTRNMLYGLQALTEVNRRRLIGNQADHEVYKTGLTRQNTALSAQNTALSAANTRRVNGLMDFQFEAAKLNNEMLQKKIFGVELDNRFKDATMANRVQKTVNDLALQNADLGLKYSNIALNNASRDVKVKSLDEMQSRIDINELRKRILGAEAQLAKHGIFKNDDLFYRSLMFAFPGFDPKRLALLTGSSATLGSILKTVKGGGVGSILRFFQGK